MLQRDEGVVVCTRSLAQRADLCVDVLHLSQELDRLVDEVGSQVVEDTRAGGAGTVFPGPGLGRLPPLEAGLEAAHLTELVGVDEATQGEVVTVPATVLEGGEGAAGAFREGDQRIPLLARDGEWLVDDDVQPGLEKCARLLGVARRWRRDDGKLEAEVAGPVEEGGQVRDDLGSRKVGAHLVGALGTARDDGDEVEVRVGGDEGGVEVASTHAVADERCTDPHGPTLPRA